VDYVLGKWSSDEKKVLQEKIANAIEMIKSFGTIGVAQTMNQFNNK
jgi:PTH1 family peptidyl-tRNA hydrolase